MADPAAPIEAIAAPLSAVAPQESPAAPLSAAPAADLFGDAPAAPAVVVPHPAEIPSLLEGVGKKEEPKAAEAAAPVDPAKPVEAKVDVPAEVKAAEPEVKVEPPVVAPEKVDWKFELPPVLKADEATVGRFSGILDNILTPKEGETRVTAAQRLLDMHAEAMVAYDKQLREDQNKSFNDYRAEERKKVMADPVLGGNGHQTAMGVVARMRDMLMSDAKPGTPQYAADEQELNQFLRTTGAGDHRVFLKMLYRAGNHLDEPPAPAAIGKPTPTNGIRPGNGIYRSKAAPNGAVR